MFCLSVWHKAREDLLHLLPGTSYPRRAQSLRAYPLYVGLPRPPLRLSRHCPSRSRSHLG
ncbi:hypothetical protein SEA_SASSAY_55 [Mycobacterium phage Sassay]|nr:hypothetical protein SEA_SASSAY_55 [Mycobacterium phage Sassay]ATN92480.1 hypothetical protein SEA_WILLEZ_55 [Mycobacterium phage Willez]